VARNLKDSVIFVEQTLLQRQINPSWTSPVIATFTILILCGLWSSLWRSDSQTCALYFVFYECIYLLWPWDSGFVRFGLAVLPLAYLYLVEGAPALWRWSRQYPRAVGTIFLLLSTLLAFAAARRGWAVSAIFWILSAILCAGLIWKGQLPPWSRLSWARSFFQALLGEGFVFSPRTAALVAVTYLVATGVAAEIPMGWENLGSGSTKFETVPEIQAARWIKSHTDADAIIAASLQPLVYHYSRRRVIWFPPISNPTIIMDGIQKYRIQYLVIIKRDRYYYLPPETTCYSLLEKAYPQSFRLVEANGPVKIYEVIQG
jgi:hypothetical protein